MAKIFYAVSGEGRGHATRARALIEELRKEHELVLYAPGCAHEMLAPHYRDSEVTVRPLPGLRFFYSEQGKLDYWRTAVGNRDYLQRFGQLVRRLTRHIEAETPDLVLTDFEPALPRAARRCGVPFVSIDHQHFLLTSDLGALPRSLRWHAALMALVVRAYYQGQQHTLVSSFYFPPLRRERPDVTQIGVLLRPEIVRAQPEQGRHLVAYLRRLPNPGILRALAACGREVRLYGLGARPSKGLLRFHAIDIERFAEDLASCRALITTAGNQLIGEALYLKKPVLAMPEPGNREQEINAYFLQRSGAGVVRDMETIEASDIHDFLERSEQLVACIDHLRLYGNLAALQIIRRHLPGRSTAASTEVLVGAAPKRAVS